MKFAALGRTRWLFDAISVARSRGHHCVLIATAAASPEYTVKEGDFERLAKEIECLYLYDARLDKPEHLAALGRCGAEIAISVNWPTLIGKAVRDRFPLGVLNAHAGDLPRYRGNACPNWAILNGEPEVTVSIHEMVDELDAGAVFVQDRFPLSEDLYIGDVYRWLDATFPALLAKALDGLEKGTLQPKPQPTDPDRSLRCYPRQPEDGLIDWRLPARQIARLVRASAEPFAGAYTFLDGRLVRVWRAKAGTLPHPSCGVPGQVVQRDPAAGTVAVLTGEGVLIMEEIATEEQGRGSAAVLVRSTRLRFGLDIAREILSLRQRIEELERRLAAGEKHDSGGR
jgi:UDP-4-amino-4-deoxy-L-arabinose formyltransferase/UDP-glucuronic acid dehydrogenase (UDP-4-keto-hexauronic acid decarboxylating)